MTIPILQFNCHKSNPCLNSALAEATRHAGTNVEVALVQEPGEMDMWAIGGWTMVQLLPRTVGKARGGARVYSTILAKSSNKLQVHPAPFGTHHIVAAILTKPNQPKWGQLIVISVYLHATHMATEVCDLQQDLLELFWAVKKRNNNQWVGGGDFNIKKHFWGQQAAFKMQLVNHNLMPFLAKLGGNVTHCQEG